MYRYKSKMIKTWDDSNTWFLGFSSYSIVWVWLVSLLGAQADWPNGLVSQPLQGPGWHKRAAD